MKDNQAHSTAKKILLRLNMLTTSIKILFHKFLNKMGVPAIVGNVDIYDELSNQNIKIRTGILFTVITINNRDYYFRRLTGKFDGTGSGLI